MIEVLSPSTEKKDRTLKSEAYRNTPSLQAYILVSQTEYAIELYERTAIGEWKFTHVVGAEHTFTLLGCELKLAEVYRKIKL